MPIFEDCYVWSRQAEKSTLARYVVRSDLPKQFNINTEINLLDLDKREGKFGVLKYLYDMVKNQKIKYALTDRYGNENPDHFQNIRKPTTILRDQCGTCLDLAVLFAAMALKAELLPVIILLEGHALIGVSRNRTLRTDPKATQVPKPGAWVAGMLTDLKILNEIQEEVNEYIFIECTGAAQSESLPEQFPEGRGRGEDGWMDFKRACEAGREQLLNEKLDKTKTYTERAFRYALDIHDLQVNHKLLPQGIDSDVRRLFETIKDDDKTQTFWTVPVKEEITSPEVSTVFHPKPEFFERLEGLLSLAIQQRVEGVDGHAIRGVGRYFSGKFREAEGDFSLALQRDGNNNIFVRSMRAMTRYKLRDYAGVEEDLTIVAAQGGFNWNLLDDIYFLTHHDLRQLSEHRERQIESVGNHDCLPYFLRAIVRLHQHKYIEAEADFIYVLKQNARSTFAHFDVIQEIPLSGLDKYKQDYETWRTNSPEKKLAAIISLMLGDIRFSQQRFVEAEHDFDRVLDSGFDDPEIHYKRGLACLAQSRYKKAADDLDIAIANGYEHTGIYYARGLVFQNLQRFAEAESDFNMAIQGGLNNPDVYLLRGLSLRAQAQSKIVQAEVDFNRAINTGKVDAIAYLVRGHARRFQGKSAEADKDLEEAHALGQGDPGYHTTRAEFFIEQGKFSDAEKDLSTALNLGLDHSIVYYLRGLARQNLKQYEEAESDFTEAIIRGRDDADVYFKRGSVRQDLEKFSESESDFTEAIKRRQDDVAVYYKRGLARYELQKYSDAESDFTEAIHRGLKDASIYIHRGLALAAQKEYSEARLDFTTAIDKGDANGAVFLARGVANYELGNYLEAEQDLTNALHLGHRDERIYVKRGLSRLSLGQPVEAEFDFDVALSSSPENAILLYFRGVCKAAQGKWEEAERDYIESMARSQQRDAFLLQALTINAVHLGKLQKAEEYSKTAIELAPNDKFTYRSLGLLCLARRDYYIAVSHFQSESIDREEENWGRFYKGLTLLLAGQLDEASTEFQTTMTELKSPDRLEALLFKNEFEYWTLRQSDRLTSPEAKQALEEIREILARLP